MVRQVTVEICLEEKFFGFFSDYNCRYYKQKLKSPLLIYDNNPFNDIVCRRELNENIEKFPDELRNANEHPFYISYSKDDDFYPNVTHSKRSNKKAKDYFVVAFMAFFYE